MAAPELELFLEDLGTLAPGQLRKLRAMTILIMQIARFTREEQKRIIREIDERLRVDHADQLSQSLGVDDDITI